MDSTPRRKSPPLEAQVPETPAGTPSDVPPQPQGEIIWWKPDWQDAVRHLGYRWIYLLPAVLLLLMAAGAVFLRGFRDIFLVLGIKLFLVVVAIAASLAGHVFRCAAKARKEPFCIHCGYNLTGLPDDYRCPECGRPYTWRAIEEYRRDPQWFIERYYLQQRLPPPATPFAAGPGRRRRSRDGT
jgi:hypothetical protein